MFVVFLVQVVPDVAEVSVQTDGGVAAAAAGWFSTVYAKSPDVQASGRERPSSAAEDAAKTDDGNEQSSAAAAAAAENGAGEEAKGAAKTPAGANPPDRPETVASDGTRPGSTAPLIETEHGRSVAETIGAFAFLECSAKTKEGVRDVFEAAVRAIRRDNRHGQCVFV